MLSACCLSAIRRATAAPIRRTTKASRICACCATTRLCRSSCWTKTVRREMNRLLKLMVFCAAALRTYLGLLTKEQAVAQAALATLEANEASLFPSRPLQSRAESRPAPPPLKTRERIPNARSNPSLLVCPFSWQPQQQLGKARDQSNQSGCAQQDCGL